MQGPLREQRGAGMASEDHGGGGCCCQHPVRVLGRWRCLSEPLFSLNTRSSFSEALDWSNLFVSALQEEQTSLINVSLINEGCLAVAGDVNIMRS